MRLGCLADDYTGASDVATALSRAGRRTLLLLGVPEAAVETEAADAIVVAAKIRTAPVAVAVETAERAAAWLTAAGAERLYFKYCSTFDSTPDGNIGPIADALLDAVDATLTVVCPAAPEHGRTIYQGHLFVGANLLSDTPMRDHPLTPMRDSSLLRLLAPQTGRAVGLVAHEHVRAGATAVARELGRLRAEGAAYAVVDALDDGDLRTLARACQGMRVVTGAAGLAPHLDVAAVATEAAAAPEPGVPTGPAAILAGSCSAATLEQVARARERLPSLRLDPRRSDDPERLMAECVRWLDENLGDDPVMIYSSAKPGERSADAAETVERVLGAAARELVARGVRRIVVAGGETSAAVADAVGVSACRVGREEAPGVPWLFAEDGRGLALLLKSGNFGDPELLVRACERPA
jgi:uncharacterized protein YgbK (DUF1537 family)